MGLMSQRVERSEIVAGDHIYTWRTVFTYSHHGIYVGENKVVHFIRDPDSSSPGKSLLSSSHPSSKCSPASSSYVLLGCPNAADCGFRLLESGVTLSCLDCFLGDGFLYRFEYGVSPLVFVAKARGGRCTTAKSDPHEDVIHRAMYLLHKGFGNYDVFRNNCEDFALYCKTGLQVRDLECLGRSGQASSVIGAPLAAIISMPLQLLSSSPVGVVTTGVTLYSLNRYATDIGVRDDVIKVKVEDLALFHDYGRLRGLPRDKCHSEHPSEIPNDKCRDELSNEPPKMDKCPSVIEAKTPHLKST